MVGLVAVIFVQVFRVVLVPEAEREKMAKAAPTGLAREVRDSFAESVNDTVGGEESRLGLAYLAGMKEGLSDETQEMLRAVGLTHLVVASGTHLSIIVEFLKKRLGKYTRFAGLLYSLVAIFIFGEIIGWTASITRAAIVSALALAGWYSGRKAEPWRVILIAMAITLLINPLFALDLGWELSFASFTGIMIIAPILKRFFYGQKKPGLVAETLIASIAATVMCAPILLYYFGSISLISLVANLLILPTIPFAMGMTFLTGLSGFLPAFFLFDWLRFVVVKITTLVLDYHLFVMEFFARQTSFIVTIPKGDARVYILYIVVLALVVVELVRQRKRRREAKLQVLSDPERYLPFTV